MRKVIIFILAFLLVLSLPGLSCDLYSLYIAKIIDGDTIVADIELGLGVILVSQYIRLYEINTPEITGEEKEKGLIARDYLIERLSSGEIEIGIMPEWGRRGRGKYGRWLGVIYVDGVNINAELVEKGHTKKYEKGEA